MAVTKNNRSISLQSSDAKEAGDKGYKGTLVWIGGSILVVLIFIIIKIAVLLPSLLSGIIHISNISDISTATSYTIFNIAAILSLIQAISSIIISFIGLFIISSGVKKLSQTYKNSNIYKNFNISFAIIIFSLIVSALLTFYIQTYIQTYGGIGFASLSNFLSTLGLSLGVLLLYVVLSIIAYAFMYHSYKEISVLTGITEFNTAALLLIVGAVLTIVWVGGLLIFIGAAYAGYGWYKLKNNGNKNSTLNSNPIQSTAAKG